MPNVLVYPSPREIDELLTRAQQLRNGYLVTLDGRTPMEAIMGTLGAMQSRRQEIVTVVARFLEHVGALTRQEAALAHAEAAVWQQARAAAVGGDRPASPMQRLEMIGPARILDWREMAEADGFELPPTTLGG